MVLNDRSSQQIDSLASKSNLTTGQLLLWLGQKVNLGLPVYNMVFSFTITGDIQPDYFQQAFQALVERSDILRLSITELDGVPQQQVASTVNYVLPFIDFSTETTPLQTAQNWMQTRSNLSFNLQTRLFDSALLKLTAKTFIWYFNQHHLITDNWSVALLYRRLQECYGKALAGTLAAMPELPAYVDYAASTQSLPWSQQAATYWQQKRENIAPPVPLYGQSTETASPHTERTYFELSQAQSDGLRALAKTPAAQTLSIHQSQFNLFLTLVFAYLYRVSGNRTLAIAAPAHNRPTPVLKETPGVFMELFPLQVEIAPDETFVSLLKKVASESMAFLRHAQAGVSHYGIDRHINVVLSYINVTFPEFHGMPATTKWIHSGYGDNQHHLRLEVHDFDATGRFTLQFDFNRDLIPAAQRAWSGDHFCQLLDAWLENGDQPIGAVDILTKEERTLLQGSVLRDQENFKETSANAPIADERQPLKRASTLIDAFHQQVTCVPDNIALVSGQQSLTYANLDAQVNQLAHYLIKQGVEKGIIVGLFLERSVPMIVSILAILKVGAAYLPIDPAYPPERSQFMVTDGLVSILLTQRTLREKCPRARLLCWEDHEQAIAQEPVNAPSVEPVANDLAYILFTSGSTGQPKGVMVEHRNVLAMLHGFEQTAPTRDKIRGTSLCSYGFDVSVWEIFSTLCFAGTLHLVSADVVTSQFSQYLIDHNITSAYIPPALLPVVIQELERADAELALDRILVGVEPIQQELLRRYRQRIPQLRIVNGYGPTETTICATFYVFETVTTPQGITPIGRAIPGYKVYLVNPHHQQVPLGVKGEIMIGGAGLSRGYLNRSELMAERFIENPFGPGKLYRTGDQARYLPDGNLEFLGRLDYQVKIRGFRVELSEVENALNQHPKIQQSVVISQKNNQTSQTLLAYVVGSNNALVRSEVTGWLQQKLPEYMLPSTFILLDQLPLTPNGKVDRHRLSSKEFTQKEPLRAETHYTAPESPWETYLTDLWAQCLRVESVGIHDNFFDLGGDSITAIQIAAQATEAGLSLSPQHILQQATVSRVLAQTNPGHALHYTQGETFEPVPLTPIQQAFFEQGVADAQHWNQSLLLEVPSLQPKALEAALQQLVQHHSVLRCQFTLEESGWQQRVQDAKPGTLLSYFDLAEQTATDQKQIMVAVESKMQQSLALDTGQLMQAALFHLGDHLPNRLLLVIHHLVVDGLSWLTLLSDLEILYQRARGHTVARPLPTTPFQQWAVELAKTAAESTQELSYWLDLIPPEVTPLPQDFTGGDNTVASMETVTAHLDIDQTHALVKDMPKASNSQVNEVLLTALGLVYGAGLLVDVEGHGREESLVPGANLVRTVGWFTTVFPLFLTLPKTDLATQLATVKAQVRGVPQNGIGYGLLRYLNGDAAVKTQLETLPQPEILFNYLGDLERLIPPGSMFQLARGLQLSRSPRGQRRYLLEVNAAVAQGQLQVEWSYSQQVHQRETIQRWADQMIGGVRSLLTHYLSNQSDSPPSLTPVDFPLANLNQQQLGKIAALLNKTDSRE